MKHEPRQRAVTLGAIFALLALALVACNEGNSPVESCGVCAPAGTTPPPGYLSAIAIEKGRQQALLTCPGVADVQGGPTDFEFVNCDFRVGNCCAWGSTNQKNGHIRISMSNPDNILPLITWESRNYFWLFGGCSNQMLATTKAWPYR